MGEEVSFPQLTPKHSDIGSPAQIIRKPVKPIFSMSNIDMITYFPQFLKDLYKLEGWAPGTYRLHPKLNAAGEVIVAADKLKIYDEIAEGILPRSKYCGSGKKFGKNLLLKQKNVCSYILSKLGIDHATFSLEDEEKEPENVGYNEVAPEAFDIHHNDTVESEESHEPVNSIDTEHNPEIQEDSISDNAITENVSDKSFEKALKLTKMKRKKYESSDPSESSSSDTDSERELDIGKRYSRKKRSSKHSRKESEIFHRTFMKMMQHTMKSVIMKQLS